MPAQENRLEFQDLQLDSDWSKYKRLFELMPCLVTVQDRGLRLISYNQRFEERFGPAQGQYCFVAYKGRSQKCSQCPVEMTFETGRSHCSEESGYVQGSQQANWLVTTAPIRNSQGEVEAVLEMCQDITDRKMLEQDLQISEQKYWAIFNNIPNPVFVLDQESLGILDCNDLAASLFAYSKQELLQKGFLDLFLAKERAHYQRLLHSASYISQAKQQSREGNIIYTAIRVSPFEYAGRRTYLVTSSDITKRLETEQKLIQSSKMATLGEMASGVAHELNQPLTVIKTACNYLQKKCLTQELDADAACCMLQEVDSSVERASKIISHLREFSRKPDMELELVQINTVIQKALEMFSQQLKLREIKVETDLEEDLPLLQGEPVQLEQVFINLLINSRDAIEQAWKDNPAGRQEKRIRILSRADQGQVKVWVQDNGCGVPKGIRERIFEPFFTTKEVGSGTGLGLSISYRIVRDCLGRLELDSSTSEGVRFVLTFPAAQCEL
ncbi:MAG: PAS domain-containing sensor histidine kinase [Thermodesulfobacteriota bacterium]